MSTETTPNGTATATAPTPDRSVELVNKLLKLPDEVKLDLGRLLLDSVTHGFTSLDESENRDKELIRSRLEELVSGKATLLDAKEMVAKLKERYAKGEPS